MPAADAQGHSGFDMFDEKRGQADASGLQGSGTDIMKRRTLLQELKTNIQLQIILVWLALLLIPAYDELAY